MGSRVRRPLLAVLAVVAAALAVTGCVSIPNAGPVLSYPVTSRPGVRTARTCSSRRSSPGTGWSPQQIVSGFLIATAANQDQVAREYLAPAESRRWNPACDDDVRVQDQAERLGPVPQPTVPAPGAASARRARRRRR